MNPWSNNPWQNQPPPWYPNAHPHVYVPPTGYGRGGYWDQYQWGRSGDGPPPINEYRSTTYPNLNPILAADTTLVRFDVKKKPQEEIQSTTFFPNRQALATANSTTHIRLYSKSFPWSIEIKSNFPITCEGVWDAVYSALQEPIVDSEWGMIAGEKDRRAALEAAGKSREGTDKRPRRIDWLGERTMFKGLEQDEDFHKARLFPGTPAVPDTYLVKLEMPQFK